MVKLLSFSPRTSGAVVACGLLTAMFGAVPAASAQDAGKYAPRVPPAHAVPTTLPANPPAPLPARNAQLLPALKGLVFIDSMAKLQPGGVAREGIDTAGLPLLSDPHFLDTMRAFLGKPLTTDRLTEITNAVVLLYRDKGRPVVDAIVPEQDITKGTVQIVVLEGRVGQVKVEGNRYFSTQLIRGQVRLKPGDVIEQGPLLSDLDWLNRNPFRKVDVIFERDQELGRTDVVLHTEDHLPLRLYTGYENTGTRDTGSTDRVIAGVNWGNAFGLDQQLSYQIMASPDYDQFVTHSASYVVPLPWHHLLDFYGSYTRTHAPLQEPFDTTGISWQLSARYEIPLPHLATLEQSVWGAFDFKRTNNNLEFGGDRVFARTVDIAEFSVGYNATLHDPLGQTTGDATIFVSPGHLTPDDDAAAYQTARAGADPRYVYSRVDIQHTAPLPAGLSWVIRGTAQWSGGPLLGTEQLGFGGADSVRGYDERQTNGDSGFILSNEIYSPAFSPLRLLPHPRSMNVADQLQFLVFYDYGVAFNRDVPTGGNAVLSSVGPGIRYQIGSWLTLRYDYGFRLAAVGNDHTGTGRSHLSVQANFTW